MTTIRKPYTKKERFGTSEFSPSMTQQNMKEECDINSIMSKFQKTGAINHANNRAPEYGFATSNDFRESMEIVTNAQEMFNELPSSIRKRFANSPEEFLDFVQNPQNASEMASLGLIQETPSETQETENNATTEQIAPPTGASEPNGE